MAITHLFSTKGQKGGNKNTFKKISNSLLNLRFKAPRGRGPLQDDRAYKKSAHAKYGGLPSNMRRVIAKIHVFFLYVLWFCTYSWLYPSYLASPVLINPSKLIFFIIRNIQNIYCIVICTENIISSNLFFL